MTDPINWEEVGMGLHRYEVGGGWIYRLGDNAITFVPAEQKLGALVEPTNTNQSSTEQQKTGR
jgi:hypothetical protein